MRILSDEKILSALRCPICGESMAAVGASIVCRGARRHCYDRGASGYVNFCSPAQSGGGDSKQAVRARSAFLDSELYRPVAVATAETCEGWGDKSRLLIDAGCGEGYYSAFLKDCGFSTLGVDISKTAADAASKRLSRTDGDNFLFAAASVFELPVRDGCAGTVVNVFAPCAEQEYSRVLSDDGALVVVYAGEKHLMGLKKALYSSAYENTERADLPQALKRVDERRVTFSIELSSEEQIMNLFAMTPYYWRTSASDAEGLKALKSLTTEVDIIISVYKKDV